MKNCKEFENLIEEYIDNELDSEKKLEFEEHIKTCPACREELGFSKMLRQSAGKIELPEPPADFLNRVNAALDKELNAVEPPRKTKFPIFSRRWQTAAAACLVVAAFLGVNLMELNEGSRKHIDTPNDTALPITEQATPQPSEKAETAETDNAAEATAAPRQTKKESKKAETKTETVNGTREEVKEEIVPAAPTVPPQKEIAEAEIKKTEPAAANEQVTEKQADSSAAAYQSSEPAETSANDIMLMKSDFVIESGAAAKMQSEDSADDRIASDSGGEAAASPVRSKGLSDTADITVGTLIVTADKLNEAKNLAMHFGSSENGIFGMTAEKYKEYLSALESAGIDYIDAVESDGAVRFEIKN